VKPEAVHNEIHALRNLVHQATRDARNLLFELRPIVLETQGLVAAFEQYVDQLRSAENFTLHFKTIKFVGFDVKTSATIFSIVQEAINNIKRHAHAQNVWLALETRHDRFIVTIRDDGVGFDINRSDEDYDKRGSFGLLNMRERTDLIEAELQLDSRTEPPNRGTMVQLIVALPTIEVAKD
jgi:signal transduction histidine kinase